MTGSSRAHGHLSLGCWTGLGSISALRVAMSKPFEWFCVDLQHGMWSFEDLPEVVSVARELHAEIFVRVPWNRFEMIGRALDLGIATVIVPMIETIEQAMTVAQAMRYPPVGARSYGPIRSVIDGRPTSPTSANETVHCFVMIETRLGVENAGGIAGVVGVDGVIVGPRDLALSLEEVSQRSLELSMKEAITKISGAFTSRGKQAGIVCRSASEAGNWGDLGLNLLAVASDVASLDRGLDEAIETARSAVELGGYT